MNYRPLMTIVSRFLLLLSTILSNIAFAQTRESNDHNHIFSAQQLDNLEAFTRLYGYVRFFHPSDEAAGIDWDKFAMYGSANMLACRDRGELKSALTRLFEPVAPSVLIYATKHPPRADVGKFTPMDTSGLKMVAWQHLGVGLSPASVYRSVRLNRKNTVAGGNSYGFGTITGNLDALRLRGKHITLRAAVKADSGSRGQLWLRVDRPGGKMGFFDNMEDRPILSRAWNHYEITGKVDSDAVRIMFGCLLNGLGKIWLDDVHMLSGEGNQREEIKLANPDFENDSVGAIPQDWICRSTGYSVEVTTETASAGTKSVFIKSTNAEQPPELFPQRPLIGDIVFCDLPGGLSSRVPLVLYADSVGTLPRADRKALDNLNKKMEDELPKTTTGKELSVRLGDIVIAWNVFQHFYPYFDVAGCNWEDELPIALEEAGRDSTETEFLKTLQRFVAKLRDGHGSASLASDKSRAFLPPVQWTWVEDKLVIKSVYDSSTAMPAVGDIVLDVNGKPARQALEDEEILISAATPQWRRFRALANLLSGPQNSMLEFRTENRIGQKRTFALTRTLSMMQHRDLEREHLRPTGKIAEGIFYINLSVSDMSQIDSLLPDLARARGVICDLRGYPNGNHELISHLLSAPDTSTHWMAIPKTIYPDRQKPAGYEYEGWQMQPQQPHIAGKVVFLTDGRAISYAESYMGFIEHYKLADIVGEPTAGTNGNVNPLALPGGYRLTWTGMRVTKHDGSRHHGIGIQPTVPVHRTVNGIRDGKDEQLDAALYLINTISK